ncbi:butyrophilin subfamily 1 member A1-like, partial [Empidonax traillii]|uniref:butyrophilin subfamily 1 member A1-like n=1 Tax=Empidonax traillii TaxID=164674 RepID=UPI000FFD8951
FREQFSPFVHRYKWGQDQYGEQMLQYQGRTELRKDGLAKGSADLKLFHVRPSDTGTYTCFVRRGSDYDKAKVELKVTDPFFEDTHPWRTALGVVLVAVIALLIMTVYLFRIKGNVVLDPDKAHCELVVSDNGKSVTRGDPREDIPDTSNRFNLQTCVLGRDGFTSGRHYWEVEAKKDTGTWAVGVSREDGKRKSYFTLKPEEGIWAVGKQGEWLKAFTSPHPTSFPAIQAPRWIRVSLDYEEGRVSFFSVDKGIHIFTFSQASFGGRKVYPCVWVGHETCLKIWP